MTARVSTGRRALALSVLTGAFVAAMLGFAAHPAQAAYTAKVQAGTLKVTGDAASDKLVAAPPAGSPTTLQLDVGEDGTADFSFDRNTFTAIDVTAGGGDDEVRVDQSGGAFTDEAITIERRRRRRHADRRRRRRDVPRRRPATTSSTATSAPTPRSLGTRRRPLPVGSRRRQRHRRRPGRQRRARLQRLQHRREDRRLRQRHARAVHPQRRRDHDGPRRRRARSTSARSAAPTP